LRQAIAAERRYELGEPVKPRIGFEGFVTPTVAGVSFVSKMADADIVRSPPIPT
jgi:hypothetical protein